MQQQRDRNEWMRLIAEWETSGQSQREFCRERQLSYRSFLKRRREESDHTPASRHGKLQAVPLTPPLLSLFPELAMELDIVSLVIPIGDNQATVVINGKISIAQLGHIVAACTDGQGQRHAAL